MNQDKKHRINGTRIILLLILLLTVFTSTNEFTYPVIPLSPTYRGIAIAALLLIGIILSKGSNIRYLRVDIIETILLIRIIYYSIIILAYSSSEYLLNYLAVIVCFLAYSWSSKVRIDHDIFLRWVEVFVCALEIQTIIAAITTQRAGVQLYLIKTNIVAPIGASNFITTFVLMMFPFIYKWETNIVIKNIMFIMTLIFIFMSRSNSGLIVFALMLISLLAVERRYKSLKIIGALLATSIIVYVIDINLTGYLSRFIDSLRPIFVGGISNNISVANGRVELYNEVIQLIMKKPIFGYGFNYRAMILNQLSAHNWFLEALITGGIISLILYLLCFGCYIKEIIKSRTLKIQHKHAFIISIMTVLVQGIVEPSLGSLVFDVIFWVIIGQGIQYSRNDNINRGYE